MFAVACQLLIHGVSKISQNTPLPTSLAYAYDSKERIWLQLVVEGREIFGYPVTNYFGPLGILISIDIL